MISIKLEDNLQDVKENLEKLKNASDNTKKIILKNLAKEVPSEIRSKYYSKMDSKHPNKMGGKRTHFWAKTIGKSVQGKAFDDHAVVSIAYPIYQKVFGGTIKPTHKKALTIPINKKSYGKTVTCFDATNKEKLFYFTSKKGNRLGAIQTGKGKRKKMQLMYLITKSVKQKPTSYALPPDKMITHLISKTTNEVLKNEINRI